MKAAMWKPDPWMLITGVARWPVTTQVQARRNALLACTVLAQRMRERDEVEEFVGRMSPPVAPQASPFNSAHNR
ncbi:hypothetical protein [Nocardioides pocheonensis]|uniref:hypothetical protein n=1 Tax=Nocardioides pocheonensis TaxID=661485 RepID=UPI0011CE4014|nr:hypothetical protein [Nocardioides pocheonensis]